MACGRRSFGGGAEFSVISLFANESYLKTIGTESYLVMHMVVVVASRCWPYMYIQVHIEQQKIY